MQASSSLSNRSSSSITLKSESPETSVILPPSPRSNDKLSPGVSKAIQLLKDRQNYLLEKPWNAIRLQLGEYGELCWRLEKDEKTLLGYVKNEVRYERRFIPKSIQLTANSLDYDPNTLELVVRMPTRVHERLLTLIQTDIQNQLDTIQTGNDLASTLAQKIGCDGSADLNLEDGALRSPDKEFGHKDAQYPGLIIEVANSQSKKDGGKDIPKLADQYIVESNGSTQTVIGICLDYRATKKATVSIWHPKYGVDEQGEYLAAEQTLVFEVYKIDITTTILN